MTYGEDAQLMIPLITGFFFLSCAWFASKHIQSSVMQIVIKYASFFMALLSILIANANATLNADWIRTSVWADAYHTSMFNTLSSWEIALVVFLILAFLIFVALAFIEGVANLKNIANKHEPDNDNWGLKPL